MNWLGNLVQSNISLDDTVLDLGVGIQQGNDNMVCKSVLGVDIFDNYLNHIKSRVNTVKLDMSETDRFMDKSYDVVICLDVVEHLELELAQKVISECKRIARKKAIIYTPRHFKDNMEAVENVWNLGYNEKQKHLCVLTKTDFHIHGYHVDYPSGDDILAVWG